MLPAWAEDFSQLLLVGSYQASMTSSLLNPCAPYNMPSLRSSNSGPAEPPLKSRGKKVCITEQLPWQAMTNVLQCTPPKRQCPCLILARGNLIGTPDSFLCPANPCPTTECRIYRRPVSCWEFVTLWVLAPHLGIDNNYQTSEGSTLKQWKKNYSCIISLLQKWCG